MTYRRRNRRPPLGKLIRDSTNDTHELTDAMRSLDQAVNAVTDRLDDQEAEWARQREVEACRFAVSRFPERDPRHLTALRRLKLITGRPYLLWRRVAVGLWRMGRAALRELGYALFVPLMFFLIAVFNLVAIFLFFWLLSLL